MNLRNQCFIHPLVHDKKTPQQPSELWEPKPRPEYLEILTNPIDKFWSETEEDSERHRRQPASHPRNIERRESVELCAIHYDEDYTKYEPIRLKSPSYVYPKVNRTHSATFYIDPKVLPLAFINAAYINLRRAHTAGEITAEISEKRKQRSRKRRAPDPSEPSVQDQIRTTIGGPSVTQNH